MMMASPTPDKLTIKDQASVQGYLSILTDKWTEIGLELRLDPGYLDKLKARHKLSEKDRLGKVISSWLKQKHGKSVPTWKALCSALRSRDVCGTQVAELIERRMGGQFQLDDLSQSMSTFRKVSNVPKPSGDGDDIAQIRKACATIKVMYPTDVILKSPFPHVMTSGMSAKEKDTLFERLLEESSEIRLAFTTLVSSTAMSLLERNEVISGETICDYLKFLNLPHFDFTARLQSAIEIMGNLNEFWSFLDYYLLELIIQKFGTPTDRDNLKSYKHSLAEYSRRRLFECPANFSSPLKENEKALILKRKDRRTFLSDLTLNEVQIFLGILKKHIDVNECDLRLISYERDGDSLELQFAILSEVSTNLFPLSEEKKDKLEYLDIWYLECEDNYYEKDFPSTDTNELSHSVEIELLRSKDEVEEATNEESNFLFESTISTPDEDIGTHTSIAINNKRIVVEVSSCSKSTYKSYKVSKQREGSLQWLSGAKGTRYGTGKCPKIALNDQGFVVEADEETEGKLFCRVGQLHTTNMIIWTESTEFTSGSNPCITMSHKTVVVAFKRANDAFYRIGTLNTTDRSIIWSNKEHRFISGILDLAIASNPNDLIVAIYSKQMVTSALSPIYSTVGTLNKIEKKIAFSQQVRASPQSVANGTYPSVALNSENEVIMACTQHKTAFQRRINYRLGSLKTTAKMNDFEVTWSEEGTIEFKGKKATVTMNDKNCVLISHSKDGESFVHIGKIYRETTI